MVTGVLAQRLRMRAGYLSLGVAVVVVAMKVLGYALTGSVAILSDAGESLTNIVAAVTVLLSLRLAWRPADYEHPYGHSKIEYLSSALEGALILAAAAVILFEAGRRLFAPVEVEQVAGGVLLLIAASLLNAGAAWYLRRVAKRTESVALAANARHLLIDVWNSAGVLVALGLVAATGWLVLDPLVALYVAYRILREGWQVMARAAAGLLDSRLPDEDERVIIGVLNAQPEVLGYHRLRSRQAGFNRFAEVDIFVAPDLTVRAAHDLAVALEDDLRGRLARLSITIHVEPFEAGRREGATLPQEEFERP